MNCKIIIDTDPGLDDAVATLLAFPTLCPQSTKVKFVLDSPLEESGFELLVPLVDAGLFRRNGTEITRVRERCSRIRQ
jgi:hypothetical protein